MKKLIFGLLIFFSASSASAQQGYTTALGLKVYPGALTVKHFIQPNGALEGLVHFWGWGFRITGLYEYHGPIKALPGLQWYGGGGAHIGAWNSRYKNEYPEAGSGYFGIDGVIGLDYKIGTAPINLSLDWQPSFTFGNGAYGYYGLYSGWGGLGIRYTLK